MVKANLNHGRIEGKIKILIHHRFNLITQQLWRIILSSSLKLAKCYLPEFRGISNYVTDTLPELRVISNCILFQLILSRKNKRKAHCHGIIDFVLILKSETKSCIQGSRHGHLGETLYPKLGKHDCAACIAKRITGPALLEFIKNDPY